MNNQTHCIHGHLFDEENTYIKPNGTRFCRKCRNAAVKRVMKLRNGKTYRAREDANADMRKFQKRVREESARIRLERGCALCGYRDHFDALQWDHIIPLRSGKKRTGPKTFTALAKVASDENVQVLCANCHAIKSNDERRSG